MKAFGASMVLCACLANPAAAVHLQQGTPPSGATSRLTACRAIADSVERLACYDTATDTLIRAEQAGELVVMDRDDVRQTRRSLFGFSLPRIALFGGRDGDDGKRAEVENVDRLETTIRSARQTPLGKWILVMEDGAVWNQTDTRRLSRDPAPGMNVAIRKAAIGSFFANIDRQVAIRVQRQQ